MSDPAAATAPQTPSALDRRRFMTRLAGLGVASAAFPRVLLALAEEKGALTEEVGLQAEKVAGLTFTDAQRKQLLKGMNDLRKDFEKLRAVPLPNGVPPALRFSPSCPGPSSPRARAS